MYVQYTNPAGYPPLQHSSRILATSEWKVLFLGSGAQGADTLEFPPHPNIRVKRLPFCPAGWRQKVHYAKFILWVLLWVVIRRPRWVYASDPLSCPVAALLTFIPGLRILYHEHDWPTEKLQCSRFEKFIFDTRRRVAQRANLCVVPNEHRGERFRQQTGTSRPIFHVWNCPALDDVVEKSNWETSDDFVVFFHGSIVPARLPFAVVNALTKLPNRVVLHVAGYETAGHAGYLRALTTHARQVGVQARFKFLGTFPRRESLLDECRHASVGLALTPLTSDDLNEQAMAGASNKPFDYMACGLALLVSDLSDWHKMFIEPGYGLACDPEDADSIAAALTWFLEHPAEIREMSNRAEQRILSEWNYEKQFSSVLQHLQARSVQA